MPLELTIAALRRVRIGILVRVISVSALVAAVVAFYPSVKGDASLDKSFGDLPDVVRSFLGSNSIITPVGYLASRVFAWLVPAVLIALMVGRGAAAIAGEEENHTLNLVLALPVSRRSVLLQRLLAMLTELVIVLFAVWLPLVALSGVSDITIGIGYQTAAVVSAGVLALAFGALALAAGAATGSRAFALGIGSALAGAGYVIETIARVVSSLRPLRPLTVWRWYDNKQPLTDGIDPVGMSVLIVLSVIVLVGGWLLFERRDVRE